MSIRPQNAQREYSEQAENQFRTDLARQVEQLVLRRSEEAGVSGGVVFTDVERVEITPMAGDPYWVLRVNAPKVPSGTTLVMKVDGGSWEAPASSTASSSHVILDSDGEVESIEVNFPTRDEGLRSLLLGAQDASGNVILQLALPLFPAPWDLRRIHRRVTEAPVDAGGAPEGTLFCEPLVP